MHTRRWLVIALLVILAIMFSACQQVATQAPSESQAPSSEEEAAPEEAQPSEPVRVAFVGPLTGPGSADLLLASKGAQLAVDQHNAEGGICDGRTIKLELYDDKADPKEGANVASKLCGDEGILSVAHGWNSSVVLAAAPIFNECGLTQVDYFGVAPAIREAGPYTFRVIPTGELMARYLADWMVNGERYTRIAAIYENTDYGKGLYDVFAAAVEEFGGTIVDSEAILMDQKDFSSIINKFKAADTEAVAIFGQYEAAAFWAKQAGDLEFEAPLYGSDGIFAPELINLAGDAAEGIFSMAAYSVDSVNPVVRGFVDSFVEAFGTNPNNGAGYAYDAMNIMLDALDGGGCTREGAKEWMTTQVIDYPGVTGVISFDEDGDRMFQQGMYVKLMVKNGEFKEIRE